MATTVSSDKPIPSWWRNNVVALALLGALFGAFMSVMDTFIINKPFLGVDAFPAGYAFSTTELRTNVFAYLLLGSWVGVFVNLILNRNFGKVLQPDFKRERFISARVQLPIFATGLLAAVFTFTQIFVATGGDPSYLIALSNFAIVYIVLIEGFGKRNLLTRLAVGVMALVGSILVSLESLNKGFTFSWGTLFLMVVVVGGTMAISRIIESKNTDQAEGPVNFAFWRFLWLAVVSTIATPLLASATGTFPQFVTVVTTKFWDALPYIVIVMFFAYGTNLLRIVAQRHEGECTTSRVSIILATTAAFALPLTFLAKSIFPNIYSTPTDSTVWVLRGIGTILIVSGVIGLEKLKKR